MKIVLYYAAIIFQKVLSILPQDEKKVFANNYWGKGYGDNCKYVIEALRELDSSYTFIWPVKRNVDTNDFPSYIQTIRYYSPAFFYHLATSGTWISNVRLPWFFVKGKNQLYIQVWHGNNVLKRVEKDAGDALDHGYIKSAKHDSKIADLMVSNGRWWTQLIREAFWYDGNILECGTPRLRAIYQDRNDNNKRARAKLHISEDTKLLLYAPTFRADFKLTQYTLDYERVRKCFENKYGGKWIIGVRLHPNLIDKGIRIEGENILELTTYPDMYELMAATDVMITDYSSIMFEAGFAGIPVILYAPDIEEYRHDRDFYFKFDELPYPLAESNNQLEKIVSSWNQEEYEKENHSFKERLGVIENGSGAKQIASYIHDFWK